MKPTYEELEKEVARLRGKLSPLEDKEFTAELKEYFAMPSVFMALQRLSHLVRGRDCISARPGDIWAVIFGTEGNTREIAKLGRSLQALGWERGAKRGNLIFTIPVEEL